MKICGICKQQKTVDKFGKDKYTNDGLNWGCKECRARIPREKRGYTKILLTIEEKISRKKNSITKYLNKRYEFINSFKDGGCTLCGEKDVCCLDFHHKNTSDKFKSVCELIRYSKNIIIEEIKKCEILCSNCHIKRHIGTYVVNKNKYVEKNRQLVRDIQISLGCIFCSQNDDRCLEFHHLDSNDKVQEVSKMVINKRSIKAIKNEIDKCVVCCRNCHRKLHKELINLEDYYEKILSTYNSDYILDFVQRRMVTA